MGCESLSSCRRLPTLAKVLRPRDRGCWKYRVSAYTDSVLEPQAVVITTPAQLLPLEAGTKPPHRQLRFAHCNFVYSALASFRMGMSGSAAGHRLNHGSFKSRA